jgi:hypothetical protein
VETPPSAKANQRYYEKLVLSAFPSLQSEQQESLHAGQSRMMQQVRLMRRDLHALRDPPELTRLQQKLDWRQLLELGPLGPL